MTLETLRQFLMWCSILNLACLMLSFVVVFLARRWVVSVHARIFGLSHGEINRSLYGFLGFYKIAVIVLFVVPWVATIMMTAPAPR